MQLKLVKPLQYRTPDRPGYGLDGPGFESRQKQNIFLISETSRQTLGPVQLPIQWVPVLFPGGKAAGA
jgi:hypothetical protein